MQQPAAPAFAEPKAPSALGGERSDALAPEYLAPPMTHNNHNPSATWGLKAVAAAVLLSASFTAQDAYALSLGRALVQSNLGEPLRAEIEIPSITAQELNSLQVQVGSQEAFRAASMGYSPLLTSVALAVERAADGRYRIVLTSNRVVDEPFLDLVIEANWDSGRLTRTYTMLFDPPNLRAATPAPLLPSGSSVAVPVPARPAPPAPAAVRPAPAPAPSSVPSAAAPAARPVAPAAAPRPAPAQEAARSVSVQRGDTAGAIALANRPAGVSLDQMLVAMLRGNPDAFIDNNVNRMKAGVVLDMPDEAAASQVSATEARQIIAAQSRDFNDYRRRLAGLAPLQQTPEAGRAATGTVQAEVADAREAAPTPDRLTLSQGAVQSGGEEARIAAERAQAEAGTRVAELSRNLEELNRLSQTAPAVPADSAAPPAAAGPADATAPGIAVPGAATPADAAAAPAPSAPSTEPPPPPAAPPVPPVPAAAPAEDATAFMRDLMANPLALPVGGGVLALLLVLALVRARRNRSAASRTQDADQNEPYADASEAGESVDTSQDAAGPPSSMMYSPSQLDAAGDVDPVAEADVYLAYGRDKQAEEILQDALRNQPTRLAVHMKLLEIYSNRKDPRAYAATAAEVVKLTSAVGADWEQAREWGMALDPTNPLYQPNDTVVTMPPLEEPASTGGLPEIPLPESASSGLDFDLPETSPPESTAPKASQDGYDFDLDLTQGAPLAEEAQAPKPASPGAVTASPAPDTLAGGLDFDIDSTMTEDLAPEPQTAPPAGAAALSRPAADMDFDLDLSEIAEPTPDIPATPTPPADAPVAKPLDFDGISLDLDTPPDLKDAVIEEAGELPSTDFGSSTQDFGKADGGMDSLDDLSDLEAPEGNDGANPLETKLSLAEEFDAIGDTEGARSLAEEVLAEATGDLAARARAFIARLG